MKIFILRHGDAEAIKTGDFDRRLTSRGKHQIESLFSMVSEDLSSIEKIYSSPYVRAQETASLVVNLISTRNAHNASDRKVPDITTIDNLVPESSLMNVMAMLEQESAQSILLVSHQPLVGELVNRLCASPSGYYAMGTGNMACIELDVAALGCGNLHWLKVPE